MCQEDSSVLNFKSLTRWQCFCNQLIFLLCHSTAQQQKSRLLAPKLVYVLFGPKSKLSIRTYLDKSQLKVQQIGVTKLELEWTSLSFGFTVDCASKLVAQTHKPDMTSTNSNLISQIKVYSFDLELRLTINAIKLLFVEVISGLWVWATSFEAHSAVKPNERLVHSSSSLVTPICCTFNCDLSKYVLMLSFDFGPNNT